ncbi:hypothetical protein [Nostoc sp. FACHB-145]|uniref:hypothetical protein n=1 Tax=Nostoc sp. FACHB-145 TaxID=2692836 RepID=UPI0016824B43|nr:hypothetical protein [Nostoc sp. FACHB-145]MBD2473097.1 hypothetical protein [Nostoc sp. FACHB-145]
MTIYAINRQLIIGTKLIWVVSEYSSSPLTIRSTDIAAPCSRLSCSAFAKRVGSKQS